MSDDKILESWDGKTERRVVEHIICKKEKEISDIAIGIVEIKGDVKHLNTRINGSMDKIALHVADGDKYRRLIIGTAISLVLTIIGGISTTWLITSQLGYTLGKYANQIEMDATRLNKIEEFHVQLTKQQHQVRV